MENAPAVTKLMAIAAGHDPRGLTIQNRHAMRQPPSKLASNPFFPDIERKARHDSHLFYGAFGADDLVVWRYWIALGLAVPPSNAPARVVGQKLYQWPFLYKSKRLGLQMVAEVIIDTGQWIDHHYVGGMNTHAGRPLIALGHALDFCADLTQFWSIDLETIDLSLQAGEQSKHAIENSIRGDAPHFQPKGTRHVRSRN